MKATTNPSRQLEPVQSDKWTKRQLKACLLAVSKLASERAEFFNPLDVMEANKIRDYVLSHKDEFIS